MYIYVYMHINPVLTKGYYYQRALNLAFLNLAYLARTNISVLTIIMKNQSTESFVIPPALFCQPSMTTASQAQKNRTQMWKMKKQHRGQGILINHCINNYYSLLEVAKLSTNAKNAKISTR